MDLSTMTMKGFLDVLASSSPAPGGGSVAALSGATGAALMSMVCRLTIGKAEYKEHEELIKSTLVKSDALAKSLLEAVDKDTKAFDGVMAAFSMPKGTDTEKQTRKEAIQAAFKDAVSSPENIAKLCLEVLEAGSSIVAKCNVNAISDIAVAALQAAAGIQGALYNIRINLPSIKDVDYVNKKTNWMRGVIAESERLSNEINKSVSEKI